MLKHNVKSKTIFITGGIGDFICLDPFFNPGESDKITRVMYCTPQYNSIFKIVKAYGLFKQTRLSIRVIPKTRIFCYEEHRIEHPSLPLHHVLDWSILTVFPQIHAETRTYQQSCIIQKRPIKIKYDLPKKYVLINHHSPNVTYEDMRQMDAHEWDAVLNWLEEKNVFGVVINKSELFPPKHPLILDLSNKTNIIEAIEICKGCSAYVGIDSWPPAVISKILPRDCMLIKSLDINNYVANREIYCAPHKEPNVVQKITSENICSLNIS